MAQKKTAGKSGSTQKKTPPKRAASKKKPPANQKKELNPDDQVRSILFFGASALIAAFSFVPGTRGWLVLQNLLRGLFGIGLVVLIALLAYLGWSVGKDHSHLHRKAVWCIIATGLFGALVQIYLGDTLLPVSSETGAALPLSESIKRLIENGKELKGGGLFAGIIALPMVRLFDVAGAKIIITLMTVIFIMLISNRGIAEMLQLISTPFVWMWNGIVKAASRGYEDFLGDFYDEADDDDDVEADGEEEEEEAPDIVEEVQQFVRRSKRKKSAENEPETDEAAPPERSPRSRRREADQQLRDVAFMLGETEARAPEPVREALYNIDVDVPIVDHNTPVPESEINRLADDTGHATDGFKMSREEEDMLQKLAEQASLEADVQKSNRLPWLDALAPKEDEGAEPDAGVYEETPEIPYTAPRLALLKHPENTVNDADKSAELREKGKLLVDTLASFGVNVRIIGIRRGPSVTRYEIQPAAGVKIARITALADDIGLNLGGKSVRIEAPIPGKPAVGVEVPNNTKDTVSLRELLESTEFQESQSTLTFAVGKDIDGNVILGDIAKMPHMIIAGTTGSGKSVCTNSIIMSILFHSTPDDVRMILVDPKVVEFQPYDGIPHLLIPVVTNPQKAAGALNWAVLEMERRYTLCATYGVRDLKGYNAVAEKQPELKKLPQIVIIIDEFADLMMTVGKEVEAAVIRIAQKARAAGIHLIIATQRPTVDVITGLIKSNVPSRIGMSVKSAQDSRIILDCVGAETLLGNGDLLFYPNGWREPKRVQGCFVSDGEVEAVASFLKENGTFEYDTSIMDAVEQAVPAAKGEKSGADDDLGELNGEEALVLKAAELAVDAGQLSTTAVQRRLKLGYAKAARIVDELEERGIVGPSEGAKPRRVIMTPQELTEWKLRLASKGNKVE